MNKYCKYTLEEDKSQNFSQSVIAFIHDSKTFKESNTLFKPKIEYRIEPGRSRQKISKEIYFFLKWMVRSYYFLLLFLLIDIHFNKYFIHIQHIIKTCKNVFPL